jgi:hypothetical protein
VDAARTGSRVENKLHVLVKDDIDLKLVVREATDLLLYNVPALQRQDGRSSVVGRRFSEYWRHLRA